ncbi:uncharacterized protein LOC124684790 isoform X2 [Lolium rigidum]|uniref:uncharacterized protein LOC124684790 isoform X2 n=1 Tax=Lolium rigidum TaxID=89674 RepID=UPI001F5D7DE1|nr:uncharacterized protein LOC124684790 isoform X2 [Lolium rigidum]XP_047075013.1 uncharacterized protein LOC124684790 isoform X2 [Lolium rigidum]
MDFPFLYPATHFGLHRLSKATCLFGILFSKQRYHLDTGPAPWHLRLPLQLWRSHHHQVQDSKKMSRELGLLELKREQDTWGLLLEKILRYVHWRVGLQCCIPRAFTRRDEWRQGIASVGRVGLGLIVSADMLFALGR